MRAKIGNPTFDAVAPPKGLLTARQRLDLEIISTNKIYFGQTIKRKH